MKVDIFIPTSNRENALRGCLESLRVQTFQNFRLIIVAKSGNGRIEKLLKDFGDLSIKYFVQRKPGIVGAANEALKEAQGDIFVRIDDDVAMDERWLEAIVETFEESGRIGGVTGPTIISEKGLQARDLTNFLTKFSKSKNFFWRFIFWVYNDYLFEKQMYELGKFLKSGVFTLGSNYSDCLKMPGLAEVDNLEACNWSARTELVKKIGGFDEILSKGLGDYSEADAAFKIKKMGYRLVFQPKAKLIHRVEEGFVEKARPEAFWRIQNFICFYFRHIGVLNKDYLIRFFVNLLMQNGYYLYSFFKTGSFSLLGAIPGTLIGLGRELRKGLVSRLIVGK